MVLSGLGENGVDVVERVVNQTWPYSAEVVTRLVSLTTNAIEDPRQEMVRRCWWEAGGGG